jgi:hypothetical protein
MIKHAHACTDTHTHLHTRTHTYTHTHTQAHSIETNLLWFHQFAATVQSVLDQLRCAVVHAHELAMINVGAQVNVTLLDVAAFNLQASHS